MEIRRCKETDIREVYNLICELEEVEFDYTKFKEVFDYKIKDNKNNYILAVEDKKVLGFLSLNIDYQLHHINKVATIEELVVSSNYRSGGIGKLLLEEAIHYAKDKNCEIIELTSNFSRERAHNFYIKNGFEKNSFKFKMEL